MRLINHQYIIVKKRNQPEGASRATTSIPARTTEHFTTTPTLFIGRTSLFFMVKVSFLPPWGAAEQSRQHLIHSGRHLYQFTSRTPDPVRKRKPEKDACKYTLEYSTNFTSRAHVVSVHMINPPLYFDRQSKS